MNCFVISSQKNKLFNCSAKPKQRDTSKKKSAQICGDQFRWKSKTDDADQQKEINKPEISNLHYSSICKIEFC